MQMFVTKSPAADKPKKLLERVRDVIRVKHYSLRTERTYCDWIERFIRFHRMRHPSEMGAAGVRGPLRLRHRRLGRIERARGRTPAGGAC